MSYSYWLPDKKGTKQEYETDNNSVVIVGANGAGKSKLGAWIEKNGFDKVHRIGAQRNLNFNENIPLKNYSQAEDLVFWGSVEESTKRDKMIRWNYGKGYTTKLLDDFENVLAALLALKNNENERFVKECRQAEKEERKHPNVPVTVIDKLNLVWNGVFPQRQLEIEDSKFYAVFSGSNKKYPANQMSDGERSVLYLASQVLCVPPNKILIIDEPETHLHRSIMNRLWKTLENMRNDCLFIYITHDTDFAASHMSADKFWITDFDGNNWTFENIKGYELPEDLLFNILGSRKKVLFVEGEKNSYDTKLYSMLYPEYYVIPCGSCTQVIQRTKAFNSVKKLHRCQVYGLIDRDFRPSAEIEN